MVLEIYGTTNVHLLQELKCQSLRRTDTITSTLLRDIRCNAYCKLAPQNGHS